MWGWIAGIVGFDLLVAWLVIRERDRSDEEQTAVRLIRKAASSHYARKPSLSKLEADIIFLFADNNDKSLGCDAIADQLHVGRSEAAEAGESLVKRQFLGVEYHSSDGPRFALLPKGRMYLLDRPA